MFGPILVEFLFRLTFGVAAAMAVTPSRWVTGGFFRVHLWVLLGLQTLAAMALWSHVSSAGQPGSVYRLVLWLAIAGAAASYVGAVIWMYERPRIGKLAIVAVAATSLAACILPLAAGPNKPLAMQLADRITSGLLLGLVTTSMLLGHWYLNTPTMKLQPLKRLIVLLAMAVAARMVVSAAGGLWEASSLSASGGLAPTWLLFVALRWLTGLAGVLVLAWLTWQTLQVPNTQSATGILYAALVLALIGELTSQLLSAQATYPV